MATLYKRGDTYYVNMIVDGKRIRRKAGKSKKIAQLILKDLEVKAARHEHDFYEKDANLEELFQAYLDYSEVNHAPATWRRYGNVIRNFRIYLAYKRPAVKKVSQVSLTLLEDYKRFRRTVDPRTLNVPRDFPFDIKLNSSTARTRTLNYEIKTLTSLFNFAQKHGFCRENPCRNLTRLKVTDSKQPRLLTHKECDRLLAHCEGQLRDILFTFLNTGLRLGELINLQWLDIDFTRRKLIVRKKEFWTPKAGEREIPLNDGMFKLLKTIKPNSAAKTDFVFPGRNGDKIKRKLRKDLIRVATDAGIKDLTKIHSLRHTFASHLVMKGVDLPTVQKLLGHSDIQTTMIYSHLAPDHLVDAVNKLGFADDAK
jgi:site-specific recombinase XerD